MKPLFKPFMPELPELDIIIHSGKLAFGEYNLLFESELKNYFQTPYVITTNTFSSAIDVVIAALDLKPGDEIIASPMACLVSTQPYAAHFIKIVWADIDPKRGTLDPEDVSAKISSKTRAIVHNHFCGYPGYIDEINEIGKKKGIPVIDDCIEAFGSKYKGRIVGNCGTDISIFSLSAVRNPNTIDGGIIVFNSESLFKKASLIRDNGIDRTLFRDELGEINPLCDISLIGCSAMPSNINGYIGLEQMKHISRLLFNSKKNADNWMKIINGGEAPIVSDDIEPNYWVFGFLTCNKKETIKKYRSLGYCASTVHINNNIYSVFGNKIELKGVSDFYNSFVALPTGWWLDE